MIPWMEDAFDEKIGLQCADGMCFLTEKSAVVLGMAARDNPLAIWKRPHAETAPYRHVPSSAAEKTTQAFILPFRHVSAHHVVKRGCHICV